MTTNTYSPVRFPSCLVGARLRNSGGAFSLEARVTFYLIEGTDSSSDIGAFHIIVEAPTRVKALGEARRYLDENCGRADLRKLTARKMKRTGSVLFSTVEAR